MADIRKPLKKFLPNLLKAQEESLNEADTVQRIILLLHQVLDYDLLGEVTRETQIKDKFVDIAIKLDGKVRLLIEAKPAGTPLRDRHIEQAERYAAEGNHPWVLLTNGVAWNLYHLTFDEGIEYERVFAVDLQTDDLERAAELLAILHRSSLAKGEHEDYWRRHQALGPESIGRALFTFDVLSRIRREVRRREGLLIDVEDLGRAIREMFSAEARERIGVVKIQRKRVGKRKKAVAPPAENSATEAPPTAAPGAGT
jgi:predicted type IV restriction endonuclease